MILDNSDWSENGELTVKDQMQAEYAARLLLPAVACVPIPNLSRRHLLLTPIQTRYWTILYYSLLLRGG